MQKFRGKQIIGWRCFFYKGIGKLQFIKMNAAYCCNMLSFYLPESAANIDLTNCLFMQDNDPKYNSKRLKIFYVIILKSSNCNLIENLWGIIKQKLADMTLLKKILPDEQIIRERILVILCKDLALLYKKYVDNFIPSKISI